MTNIVNTGTIANDGTGDPLRSAFQAINGKFVSQDGTITTRLAAQDSTITSRMTAQDSTITTRLAEQDSTITTRLAEQDSALTARMTAQDDEIQRRLEQIGVLTTPRGQWVSATAYLSTPSRDWVTNDGQAYVAASNHISGADFAADLSAGKWIALDIVQLIADMAAPSGSGLIGYLPAGTGAVATTVQNKLRSRELTDYAALRAFTGSESHVQIIADGIAGVFNYDSSDTTSADNGGTIIVDATGRRWKRIHDSQIDARWFGVTGDGPTSGAAVEGVFLQQALDFAASIGGATVNAPPGYVYINETLKVGSGCSLVGANRVDTVIKCTASMIVGALSVGVTMIANSRYNVSQSGQPYFSSNQNIVVKDLSLKYQDTLPGPNDNIAGVSMNAAFNVRIENVSGVNICQHLVDISGCANVVVTRCRSVNGYWSPIQVDTAGGVYGSSGGGYDSENISIFDNVIEGAISDFGAIQIHKNGGNFVRIADNLIANCKAGIITDSFYVNGTNTWTIYQSSDLIIENNKISALSIAGSKGILIQKNISHLVVRGNIVGVQSDSLLVLSGEVAKTGVGAGVFWGTSLRIADNVLSGSACTVVGFRDFSFSDNKITSTSSPVLISCQFGDVSSNEFYGYGINISDTIYTNAALSRTGTYAVDQISVNKNKFLSPTGATYSIRVANAAFGQFFLAGNMYFSTSTAFDFTASTSTSGIVVSDAFRTGFRPVTTAGRLTNGLIAGQQSWDSTLGKPIWWSGSVWKDATGATV